MAFIGRGAETVNQVGGPWFRTERAETTVGEMAERASPESRERRANLVPVRFTKHQDTGAGDHDILIGAVH